MTLDDLELEYLASFIESDPVAKVIPDGIEVDMMTGNGRDVHYLNRREAVALAASLLRALDVRAE